MSANVVNHPLAEHHLAIVRDRRSSSSEFRHSMAQLARFAAIEATRELALNALEIVTPVTSTTGHNLKESIGLVPILRAGIIMVDPVLELIPQAEVWHLGLYRDERTAEPVPYYNKLPEGSPVDVALILDPMLATGGSACLACQSMLDWGARKSILVSIISAPEGIDRVRTEFPDTDIVTCAVDQKLNEDKFIVPGLGDAGDRVFNTI